MQTIKVYGMGWLDPSMYFDKLTHIFEMKPIVTQHKNHEQMVL